MMNYEENDKNNSISSQHAPIIANVHIYAHSNIYRTHRHSQQANIYIVSNKQCKKAL